MKKLHLVLLVAVMAVLPQNAFADNDVSLGGFLAYVLEHNPAIQREKALYYSNVESLSQAHAGYRPVVSLDGDITHANTDSDGSAVVTQDGGNLSKNVSVSMSQPVFRGGSTLASIREQKDKATAQYWSLNRFYQDTALEVVAAYWGLYVQQSVVELQEKNYERLELNLRETTARFEAGERTKTDVAQAKARLAAGRADLESSKGAYETAKAYLARLSGLGLPNLLLFPDIAPDVPADYAQALADAQEFNPSLRERKLIEKSSEHAVNAIKGEFLPQVDFGVSTSRSYDPAPGFLEEQDFDSIQLSASIPLYTGGATRSRLRQARYAHQADQYDVADLETRVREDLAVVWSNYQSNRANFDARQEQVEASKLASDGVRKEYEYGLRTFIELLDAEQEFLQAQVDMLNAEMDVAISGFTLARQVGALTPQNFLLDVETLPNHDEVMRKIGGNWFGLSKQF